MASVSTTSDAAKNSKKQALAAQKAAIARQQDLIRKKTKDLHTFNKRVKNTKGLTEVARMQNEQISFSKKSDIHRCKMTLERLKIAYSRTYHQK